MINHIHIFGASGSGTTSLGEALSKDIGYPHFDTDNYFWVHTTPPFREKRKTKFRQELLQNDLGKNKSWILTGSLCDWGDFTISYFDLVIYLYVPQEERLKRLQDREVKRYGKEILAPNDSRYEVHQGFMNWARLYDSGGLDMRSKAMHEEWMKKLDCPIMQLKGDSSLNTNLKKVTEKIKALNQKVQLI